MITSRKCLNCNHVASQDINVQTCPACHAFYSKVEAALTRPEPSYTPSRPVPQVRQKPAGEFIKILRADTNYPAFRGVVRVSTWLLYALALIGAVVTVFAGGINGDGRFYTLLGIFVAVVVVSAAKEASLMLADLSDAAVHTAALQERSQQ